jgi:hypothetical protein
MSDESKKPEGDGDPAAGEAGMSDESKKPEGDGDPAAGEAGMIRLTRRLPLPPGTAVEYAPVEIYVGDTPLESENLADVVERLNLTNDELSKAIFQLMTENARLNSGRTKNGRAPDMATECFSTIGETLLRRGTTEAELEEILQISYRRLKVPRPNDRVKETIERAKQRLAEQP